MYNPLINEINFFNTRLIDVTLKFGEEQSYFNNQLSFYYYEGPIHILTASNRSITSEITVESNLILNNLLSIDCCHRADRTFSTTVPVLEERLITCIVLDRPNERASLGRNFNLRACAVGSLTQTQI